jgi:hypothetical protein
MRSARRACHQSAACGVPFWRSAASCSLWWCDVETLGHVMVLILSFTLWHCIWYSLSHYVCVTWSWCTCNLCIRVCLQIRVWQEAAEVALTGGSYASCYVLPRYLSHVRLRAIKVLNCSRDPTTVWMTHLVAVGWCRFVSGEKKLLTDWYMWSVLIWCEGKVLLISGWKVAKPPLPEWLEECKVPLYVSSLTPSGSEFSGWREKIFSPTANSQSTWKVLACAHRVTAPQCKGRVQVLGFSCHVWEIFFLS